MNYCIVLFGHDAAAKQQIIDITHPQPTNIANLQSPTCIELRSDCGVCGWMDDDGSYYRHEFTDHPFFDARTQMDEIRAFLGVGPALKQTMKNCIIKTNNSQDQLDAVKKLAADANYPTMRGSPNECVVLGKWHGDEVEFLAGSWSWCIERRPDWPRFDANTDMDKIKAFFSGAPMELTIERIVQARLLDLIRNNPGDELVVGFIRRDLKLALPKDVQDAGPDAICAWILEQKKHEHPTIPAPIPTRKFKISLEYSVSGSWYRNDLVDFEGEVPQEIVDRAIAEEDCEIIEDWLIEHRDRLHEINRSEGDTSHGSEEDEAHSYEGLPEDPDHDVEIQFEVMMGR